MRRDHFTVVAEPERDPPTVVISYDGPADALTERLTEDGVPTAEDVDAAFRLKGPVDDDSTAGVFSLTRRLTGEFLLEADADAPVVLDVVDTARNAEETNYGIRLERPDEEAVVLEKETLLVYDEEGNLLRNHSLIPSGVEL